MKIGDALYMLWNVYDADPSEQQERVYELPVKSITDRYVWVGGFLLADQERGTRFRCDRAELEAAGKTYCRSLREFLYVRAGVDWPLTVVSVSTPQPKAVGAGRADGAA